jgi:hypothetical protein
VDDPWRLSAPEWRLAAGHYAQIDLYPTQIVGARPPCSGERYGPDFHYYAPFARAAYDLGMRTNSANLSRASSRRYVHACEALEAEIARGALRSDTIYVVHRSEEERFRAMDAAACGRLDGTLVCVERSNGDPFRAALGATANR